MKKLQRRVSCLVLALLMIISNFTPQIAYAVSLGYNPPSNPGSIPASTYNMHGWGAMVTLVMVKNTVTKWEDQLALASAFEGGDKTSTAVTRVTEEAYLKTFPDFWLKSETAKKSVLIFNASHDKYNEWNLGKQPTNKFVAAVKFVTCSSEMSSMFSKDKGVVYLSAILFTIVVTSLVCLIPQRFIARRIIASIKAINVSTLHIQLLFSYSL